MTLSHKHISHRAKLHACVASIVGGVPLLEAVCADHSLARCAAGSRVNGCTLAFSPQSQLSTCHMMTHIFNHSKSVYRGTFGSRGKYFSSDVMVHSRSTAVRHFDFVLGGTSEQARTKPPHYR